MRLSQKPKNPVKVIGLTVFVIFLLMLGGSTMKGIRDFDHKFQPKDGVAVAPSYDTGQVQTDSAKVK